MRTVTRERIKWALWILFSLGYVFLIVNIRYEEVWQATLCAFPLAFVPVGLATTISTKLEMLADEQKSKRKIKMKEFTKVQHYNMVKNGLGHFDYNARLAETERIIAEENRVALITDLNVSIENHKTVIHNAEISIREIEVVLSKLGATTLMEEKK